MPNLATQNITRRNDKERLSTVIVAALLTLGATAQTAWDEIEHNPKLAAGKYLAYEPTEPAAATPPAGYEAFYVSVFARHGSRFLTDKEKYTEPMAALAKADSAGYLTADGRRALEIISSLAAEAAGRYGQLTTKAPHEQQLSVGLMTARSP